MNQSQRFKEALEFQFEMSKSTPSQQGVWRKLYDEAMADAATLMKKDLNDLNEIALRRLAPYIQLRSLGKPQDEAFEGAYHATLPACIKLGN